MTLRIFPSCRNPWQEKSSDALLMVCCRLSKPYMHPLVVSIFIWTLGSMETTAAYPAICFAVDDFDSTFEAVVLSDSDHCYCVLLNAHDGSAFPSNKAAQESGCTDGSSPKSDTAPAKIKGSKITLFSGFVSYQMVRDEYGAGRSGFGSLLSLGHSPGKTDKLYLKGPGGRGEVEVAVSGVADQSKHDLNNHPPRHKEVRFGTIVKTAASVAAKHAYTAASSSQSSDDEIFSLKCCLMSVSLPWEYIAHDLLFKGSPAVNL
ncbi:hypothetical protein Leryth_004986 [Lithospermum erythrorhizon]|nr:hypothetical protein Leryth_004986 [Lithospermum erythrorhizon]